MVDVDIPLPQFLGNTDSNKMCVYVISAEEAAVKVGIAGYPKGRRKALQNAHYLVLKVAHAIRCSTEEAPIIEREAHRLLSSQRIRGEWFRSSVDEAIFAVEAAVRNVRLGTTISRADPMERVANIGLKKYKMKRSAGVIDVPTETDLLILHQVIANTQACLNEGGDAETVGLNEADVSGYAKGEELLCALYRLCNFPLLWKDRKTVHSCNALNAFWCSRGSYYEIHISKWLVEHCREHGNTTFFTWIRAEAEKLEAIGRKEAA